MKRKKKQQLYRRLKQAPRKQWRRWWRKGVLRAGARRSHFYWMKISR